LFTAAAVRVVAAVDKAAVISLPANEKVVVIMLFGLIEMPILDTAIPVNRRKASVPAVSLAESSMEKDFNVVPTLSVFVENAFIKALSMKAS
jgi:hypothetical protein